jgi:hypothetical protein
MSVGAACFAAWWPVLFRCQPYREANQNDQRSAADSVAFSPINVTADSFGAGSQEDPAAVAAGDAARWELASMTPTSLLRDARISILTRR